MLGGQLDRSSKAARKHLGRSATSRRPTLQLGGSARIRLGDPGASKKSRPATTFALPRPRWADLARTEPAPHPTPAEGPHDRPNEDTEGSTRQTKCPPNPRRLIGVGRARLRRASSTDAHTPATVREHPSARCRRQSLDARWQMVPSDVLGTREPAVLTNVAMLTVSSADPSQHESTPARIGAQSAPTRASICSRRFAFATRSPAEEQGLFEDLLSDDRPRPGVAAELLLPRRGQREDKRRRRSSCMTATKGSTSTGPIRTKGRGAVATLVAQIDALEA